jgi:hypothetical protein
MASQISFDELIIRLADAWYNAIPSERDYVLPKTAQGKTSYELIETLMNENIVNPVASYEESLNDGNSRIETLRESVDKFLSNLPTESGNKETELQAFKDLSSVCDVVDELPTEGEWSQVVGGVQRFLASTSAILKKRAGGGR